MKILCLQRKPQNFRNKQVHMITKTQSEGTLMYLLFPVHGSDPGVHLVNCLWKVSSIVAKYHKH